MARRLDTPKRKPSHWTHRFAKSVWFFPAILAVPLIVLSLLQISGSSIGIYHSFLYGNTKDSNLLLNKPQPIRSDEWIVGSQEIIAQKNDDYRRINKNIGNGEDVSVVLDVPYKEWSVVFKPHDLSFFVMPFENAFAFRWWFMGYLLIVSCYLFIVSLLPNRRLFAALLSTAFFFSPFLQWWYLYGTLGSLYYCFFGGAVFIKILKQKDLKKNILWGLLLAYLATCFALVLYPPFQIPCALAMVTFAIGYSVQTINGMTRQEIWQKLCILVGAMLIAGGITLTFLATRSDVVHTIQNTAYPGKRITHSGGYDLPHLLSGNLDFQLLYSSRSLAYNIPTADIANQSEISSFLFLWPFLIIPCVPILLRDYRQRKFHDWPLLFVNVAFLGALLWMFVPHLNILGKVTFLDVVPHNRLIIGLGLLGIIQLTLLVKRADSLRSIISTKLILLYSALVLLAELLLDFHAKMRFPGFIGDYRAVAFALPIPVVIFLLLKGYFRVAALGVLVFAAFMSAGVNPLYRGTAVLTSGPLPENIKAVASQDPNGKWITENSYLENFATMNGAKSLTGVYSYPQLSLWRPLDPQRKNEYIYNRYAHVSINLDRHGDMQVPNSFVFPVADHFGVVTEPCSSFLKDSGVRFALTDTPLATTDRCAQLLRTVSYPVHNYYIYELD